MKRRIPPGAPGHPREDTRAGRPAPPRLRETPQPRTRRPTPRKDLVGSVEYLYEDEELVAVNKPAGLPVIAPEGSRAKSLYDLVTERLRRDNPKGRAAVVHRIDRDTSGLVLFATNAATKKLLMEGWDEIVRERRYLALVEGEMTESSGRRESWLAENEGGTVYETAPRTRGAKRAATRWKLVASGAGLSLLELSLETGRKHQIRVQLAALGHPVAGDARYGSKLDPLGRLCLHAELIELGLPDRRLPLRLLCPAPASFRAALGRRGGAGGPAGSTRPRPGSKPTARPGSPKTTGPRPPNKPRS